MTFARFILLRKHPSLLHVSVCLAVLCTLLHPGSTNGEEPRDVELLEPIVITGKPLSPAEVRAEELERKPSSVVVIPRSQIEESRGYNLEDVFQFAPGVYI